MSGFHDVAFPARIALGARGGPDCAVEVITLAGGQEVRNARWSSPRRRWQIATAALSLEDVQAVSDFFLARGGPLHSFRFRDPLDHIAEDQLLGIGDGVRTGFPLLKQYGARQRHIPLPVAETLRVALDDAAAASGWMFDTARHALVFDTPPASGTRITASFQFDCAVRFETSRIEAVIETPQSGRLPALTLVEVLEV